MEEYWVFTFGLGHENGGHYVKIYGSYYEARDKMINKYGTGWAFQYSESEWNKLKSIGHATETLLEVIK